MSYFVVVCGSKYTGLLSLNVRGIALGHVFPILDILTYSGDIHDQILKLCKIAPSFACIGPQCFREGPTKFLELDYKAHPDTDQSSPDSNHFTGHLPDEKKVLN